MITGSVVTALPDRARGAARSVVREARRVRERRRLAEVHVDGRAPAAVVRALHRFAVDRPDATEKEWMRRIELMRDLLGSSPRPLEIEDFGAGEGSQFDAGTPETSATRHVTTRTLAEMTRASKSARWAYLLWCLVRELRPGACLEMGACVGISAAYQAAALELNGAGRLLSLEGAPVLAERSNRTLAELGLEHRAEVRPGRFADTLSEALRELQPLSMAFVDGHHVESATLDYAEQILPRLAPEALIVFDDISWSDGMRRAWRTIEQDDRYALTVDLGAVGLGVVSASASARTQLTLNF